MQKQKIISRKQAIAEARKFYKITDCEHSREDEKSYIRDFLQALEDDGYTIKADWFRLHTIGKLINISRGKYDAYFSGKGIFDKNILIAENVGYNKAVMACENVK